MDRSTRIRAGCSSSMRCRSPAPTRSTARRCRRAPRKRPGWSGWIDPPALSMKRLACIALALLLAAPVATAQVAPPEATILTLVNAERAKAGLKPVVAEPRLARIAAAHATDMAQHSFVGHVGS